MAAAPPWGDLPDNALVLVSSFLPCRADRVHIAGVNRNWRAAVRGVNRPPLLPPLPRLPAQLPWLIFTSRWPPTFYSVVGDSYHRLHGLQRDVLAARCRGSSDGGWVVLALPPTNAYALYNLNSRTRSPLPPWFRSGDADIPLLLRTAALSAPPFNDHHMVAAIAIVNDIPTAAFWSPVREHWSWTGVQLATMPQDVVFHEGAFFFILPSEDLVVLRPVRDDNDELRVYQYGLNILPRSHYTEEVADMADGVGEIKRYLVEFQGSLLMVVRYVYGNDLGTTNFRVFMLQLQGVAGRPQMAWMEQFQLDGIMLFLAPGSSRSFDISDYDDGMRDFGFEIAFLDESYVPEPAVIEQANGEDGPAYNDEGSVHEIDDEQCPDTGCFSMVEQQQLVEAEEKVIWPPGRPMSETPPIWWFH